MPSFQKTGKNIQRNKPNKFNNLQEKTESVRENCLTVYRLAVMFCE